MEWESGADNRIRDKILTALGEALILYGTQARVDLHRFNMAPLSASRSGILAVVEGRTDRAGATGTRCQTVERVKTPDGTIYLAAPHPEIQAALNTGVDIKAALQTRCGLNTQEPCQFALGNVCQIIAAADINNKSNTVLSYPNQRSLKTNRIAKPGTPQWFARLAMNDRLHHARGPERYTELFDVSQERLFPQDSWILVIGDPHLAIDLPGVVTVDLRFNYEKPPAHTIPIQAVFPFVPFPNGSFDRVIDYNGITRNVIGFKNGHLEEPDYETYLGDCRQILTKAIELLKPGGEAYFGSLVWLRNRGRHGKKWDLFNQLLTDLALTHPIEIDIFDSPSATEPKNIEHMPRVSRLIIRKHSSILALN